MFYHVSVFTGSPSTKPGAVGKWTDPGFGDGVGGNSLWTSGSPGVAQSPDLSTECVLFAHLGVLSQGWQTDGAQERNE